LKINYILILLLPLIFYTGCSDDKAFNGRIQKVLTYDEDRTLRRVESYNYNDQGLLISASRIVDNNSESITDFTYKDGLLVELQERRADSEYFGPAVYFEYDNQNKLIELTSRYIRLEMNNENGKLHSVNDMFMLNYDNKSNLTSISNAETSPNFMIRGVYEFDDNNYIYSSFPESYRLYFALLRSEGLTLTSDIFRFNTGPNNIQRKNTFWPNGEIRFYNLFNYKYNWWGYPSELTLETYYFDSDNNPKLSFTYYYSFEYN
jgi:hypothetical protein